LDGARLAGSAHLGCVPREAMTRDLKIILYILASIAAGIALGKFVSGR
jgi:hypothetical protein